MKNLPALLLSTATLMATAYADDAFDSLKPFMGSSVTGYASGGMDFRRGVGGLDSYSVEFRSLISKPLPLPGDFELFPMFRYEGTFLRFNDTPPGFPLHREDLHTFQLPVFAIHYDETSPWIYGVYAAPALSTGFGHMDGDDFFFDAALGAAYRFSDKLIVGAGVGGFDLTGNSSILPGPALVWKPTDCVSVTLLGEMFSATYYYGQDWRFGFDVRSQGGDWNIDSMHQSRTLDLRSLRAGPSVQHRIFDQWWMEAGGGVTFANRVNLTTHGGLGLYEADLKRMDDGAYVYLSLRREFW